MNSQAGIRCLFVFLAWLVLSVLAMILFGELGEQFALGWLMFPFAVLPRVTVDRPSVIAGTLAFVSFAFGIHHTGRWCVSWLPENFIAARTWRLRQTCIVVIAVTLLFSLGTSLVGVVHQVIWLSTSRSAPSLSVSSDSPPRSIIGGLRQSEGHSLLHDQMKVGVGNFYNELPPGGTMNSDGELLHGWMLSFGPPIWPGGIDFSVPWNKPPNDRFYRCQFEQFLNPMQPGPIFDRDGFGLTHFAGNVHLFPIRTVHFNGDDGFMAHFRARGVSFNDISDGRSNTLLIGTVGQNHKPWGYPANVRDPGEGLNRTPTGFGGPPGQRSAHFVMADGSVREINDKTDPRILRALATSNGGEPADRE